LKGRNFSANGAIHVHGVEFDEPMSGMSQHSVLIRAFIARFAVTFPSGVAPGSHELAPMALTQTDHLGSSGWLYVYVAVKIDIFLRRRSNALASDIDGLQKRLLHGLLRPPG
jgi:hypothetical protein